MAEQELLQSELDGVLTLTLNRPKARNALNGAIFNDLLAALRKAASDSRVRAVVVTGAGGSFCAGGDVGVIDAASKERSSAEAPQPGKARSIDLEAMTQSLRASSEVSRLLHEMPKPTIAVMPGAAAGAGLSLALACDFRITTETAKLTTAFARLGMSGDLGGAYFLTHLVGPLKARELYFTAEVITGAQAAALGIVNRAIPEASFEEEARAFVRQAAAMPTIAIGYMKRNINAALHGTLAEVIDLEAMHMVRTMMTEDHRLGVKAFMTRQQPEFLGR